jgi:hypothetical protein
MSKPDSNVGAGGAAKILDWVMLQQALGCDLDLARLQAERPGGKQLFSIVG